MLIKSLSPNSDEISCKYSKLVFKDVGDNGSIIRRSVFDTFDTGEVMNKFTFDDFKLSSILSLGAYDMLKPSYLALNTGLASADLVESTLKSIANASKAEKSEKV